MSVNAILRSKPQKYNNIDGLRSYLSLIIIFIHVFTNGNYGIESFNLARIVAHLSNFVFMFMVISGFAMCCGYYDKFRDNKISLNRFYCKRYLRTLPYFAFVVILDVIASPSLSSLFEAFADLTLCFSLLTAGDISVVGVGWTLGIIFLFYMLFPFFVFLLHNKRRGWFVLAIALIFNILRTNYFINKGNVSGNSDFIYCAVFFIIGGLVYLYKDELPKIVNKVPFLWVLLILIVFFVFMLISANILIVLSLFALILIYAVGRKDVKALYNPATVFLSKHSMEIYLSHMMIIRIIERLDLLHIFSNELASYIVATLITTAGTIVFAFVSKYCIDKLVNFLIDKSKGKKL